MSANNTSNMVKEAVLDIVGSRKNFTIPEVAERTGLSTTTVAKHVASLVEQRLLVETGFEDTGHKGRRASVYGIKSDLHYFVGVEVRNRGLGIGLVNFTGHLVRQKRIGEYAFENSHGNFDTVCNAVQEFIDSLEDTQKERLAGIGFTLGGRVDSAGGTSASVFNFEETQDTPLATILTDRFGLPVFIENDTKAMAYADYLAAGRAWPNVLYVNFSWGLGLGIIIDGKMYCGSKGYSGEMGHICCYDNNIICHCGKKGCMETEVSGLAIHRKLLERVRNGEASVLSRKIRKGDAVTEDDILEATEKEDPLCIELVSETGRELGKQLAGMINLFNPDCIIIGGKFAQTSSYYFQQQVALAVKQYSLKLTSRDVQFLSSPLGEDAGMTGAGLCARKQLFDY